MTNDDKVLEMSRYIDIEMYDKYEEEHPFYRDMSWRMIQMGRQHRTDLNGNRSRGSTGRWRVLELGAGTGLFTKRLAEEQDWDVTAVELDSTCHDVLRRKMSPYSNVTCWRADSRSFEGAAPYDIVFSSFADHHICDADKVGYLVNVRKNLRDDGVFIVGEELLPTYEPQDPKSRDMAIRTYHEFIISQMSTIESSEARTLLAELERQAMLSGLARHGDFKVSESVYRTLLAEAHMQSEPILIGPNGRNDVGGVFVVKAFKEQMTCADVPSEERSATSIEVSDASP